MGVLETFSSKIPYYILNNKKASLDWKSDETQTGQNTAVDFTREKIFYFCDIEPANAKPLARFLLLTDQPKRNSN